MSRLPRDYLPDPLRHFDGDGPITKLTALLICKLPLICASLGGLLLWVGHLRRWW